MITIDQLGLSADPPANYVIELEDPGVASYKAPLSGIKLNRFGTPDAAVDLDGQSLNNVGQINFTADENTSISELSGDMHIDVGSSGDIELRHGNVNSYTFGDDFANFLGQDIINLSNLVFQDTTGSPGTGSWALWRDGNNLMINAGSSGGFEFGINGASKMFIEGNDTNMRRQRVFNMDRLEFNQLGGGTTSNPNIYGDSSGMKIIAPFGDSIEFRISSNVEMEINGSLIDVNNNHIVDIGYIEANSSNLPSQGFIRMNNGALAAWRNNANTLDYDITLSTSDAFQLRRNGVAMYSFDNAEADFMGKDLVNVGYFETDDANPATAGTIRLGTNQLINWSNVANTQNHGIALDGSNRLVFQFNGVDTLRLNTAEADLQDKNLINVGNAAIGQANITSGKTVAITIPDDTAAEGLLIQNTDGSLLIGNNTGVANEFSPLFTGTASGSAQSMVLRGVVLVADDVGTTPVIRIDARQDDSTPIETRPLLAIQNDGAIDWQLDNTGDVDMFGNNLLGLGYLELDKISTPGDPAAEEGRIYLREIDTDNNGIFAKYQVGGVITEVQLGGGGGISVATDNGTHSHTNGTTEQDVIEETANEDFVYVSFDMTELTQNMIVRVYEKVNGTDYEIQVEQTFPTNWPANVESIEYELAGKGRDQKITMESVVAEGAARDVHWARRTESA